MSCGGLLTVGFVSNHLGPRIDLQDDDRLGISEELLALSPHSQPLLLGDKDVDMLEDIVLLEVEALFLAELHKFVGRCEVPLVAPEGTIRVEEVLTGLLEQVDAALLILSLIHI